MDDHEYKTQLRRSQQRPVQLIYRVTNLRTGQYYLGRHQLKSKKAFEENGYWGSGTNVKRWKKQGDPLYKGVIQYCTQADVKQHEVAHINYARLTQPKLLVNKESWERQIWANK